MKILFKKSKIFLISFLIVAVFSTSGIYYWLEKEKKNISELQPLSFSPSSQKVIRDIPPNELPKLFPPKIPLEPDAPVLTNYSYIAGKKEQSTYQFISKKSLDQNFEIYQKYITDNDWTVISIVNQTDFKSISATKTPNYLSITLNLNKQTNQVVVDITMVGPVAVYKKEAPVESTPSE